MSPSTSAHLVKDALAIELKEEMSAVNEVQYKVKLAGGLQLQALNCQAASRQFGSDVWLHSDKDSQPSNWASAHYAKP